MMGLWLVVAVVFLSTWRSTVSNKPCTPEVDSAVLIIMVVFIPLTNRDSQVLVRIADLPLVTTGALENFNGWLHRFMVSPICAQCFSGLLRWRDIMLTLRWYGLSHKAALVLTLAFRFIPFIADAFQMIQDSHSMREPNLGEQDRRGNVGRCGADCDFGLVFALNRYLN